jgi:excisionase family DNA binding protein
VVFFGGERRLNRAYGGLKHLTHLSGAKRPSILARVRTTVDVTPLEAVETEFLTRSDVSKLLGVSPNTVTRWAREGRLPCQVTLGGHHRFDRELVEQLRKSLYRAGTALD